MLTLDNCMTGKKYRIKEITATQLYKSKLEGMGLLEGKEIIAKHRAQSGTVVQVGEMKLALSQKMARKILLARI